jgi:flagellar biosynthesis/type III secretory pathway protein FliH
MKLAAWFVDFFESDRRAFERFQESRAAYQRGFADGHEMGFSEGKVKGSVEGFEEGMEAGKKIYEPLIR